MKLKLRENDNLSKIGNEEIGNGGNSRLDIMLDISTGEIWSIEFCDHESNSWVQYSDNDTICIGQAHNYYCEDDSGNDLDYLMWTIEIYTPDKDQNKSEFFYGSDEYSTSVDIDEVLETISNIYNKKED